MPHKLFQSIEKERKHPNSFYKALIPKPLKDSINRKRERMNFKYWCKCSTLNISEYCIKNIIPYDLVEFIPGMQIWFNIKKPIIHNINRYGKNKIHDYLYRYWKYWKALNKVNSS